VPELVTHGVNGLVVHRSPPAFRAAFQWCVLNPAAVRRAGMENARVMAETRDARRTAGACRSAFHKALALRRVDQRQADLRGEVLSREIKNWTGTVPRFEMREEEQPPGDRTMTAGRDVP